MKIIIGIAFGVLVWSTAAKASLFNDDTCAVIEQPGFATLSQKKFLRFADASLLSAKVGGFRCEDIKTIGKVQTYVGFALMPASLAIMNSPALSAELVAAGLTLANPAVLTVAVVGAIGVSTFNIILHVSLEECDRLEEDELKNEIMRELETKYGLQPSNSQVPLEIKR